MAWVSAVPVLYDTFGDKHQLYLKALEAYQQGHGSEMCTLIREAPSAKAAIQGLLELVVSELLGDTQRKGCFMVNAGIELGTHDTEVSSADLPERAAVGRRFFESHPARAGAWRTGPKERPAGTGPFPGAIRLRVCRFPLNQPLKKHFLRMSSTPR
jgi:hypothetical protein